MCANLAAVAKAEAMKFYHGNHMGAPTNLHPIADRFPYTDTWTVDHWDNRWCAAFVYHCLCLTGYTLPVRHPALDRNFAWCESWEAWAKLAEVGLWRDKAHHPEAGDIVLFDNVFIPSECDHIAIVTRTEDGFIETAEGNFCNMSAIVQRPYTNIRGLIRL